MEEVATVVETESSEMRPAGGPKNDGGWRSKGKNWFSAKAPSVREGFKKITDKAPTVKEGLKKMSTKVEGMKINSPMKGGLKRISTTTAPVKEGLRKITSKAPPIKEGLMKGKVSLGKGLNSVSTFTQDETKLLMSKAKRKLYCTSEELEDTEFIANLESVQAWKMVLESQRNCLRRMIRDQKAFQESQLEFTSVLKAVPATSCDYSKKSVELGSALESQVQNLVPVDSLEELAQQIDDILSNYVELNSLKRKYTIAKNDVDVSSAKLESNGDSERLHAEYVKATQWHLQCKVDITEMTTKILEMKSSSLNPILLQVARDHSSGEASVNCDIR